MLMPNADKIEFKLKFVERYSKLTDFETFKKYCLSFPRRSIRVNTLKTTVTEVKKRLSNEWKLTPIPWCKEGFWIEGERRDVGNLVEHSLGYIYIQEAASMIPALVLDPRENELILDMCASPGSKTTQIGQYMKNTGLLISNDYRGDRNKALGLNVQRVGLTNNIRTLMHGQAIKGEFDKILVDAPCSGTGTVRKSIKTLRIWNPTMVTRLAHTQKSLLENAFNQLKVGGTLVYSTCSVEPEENEGVVSHLLNNYDDAKLCDIKLNIKRSDPIESFEKEVYHKDVKKCLRIWPQDNDTEGFFVAKIVKN